MEPCAPVPETRPPRQLRRRIGLLLGGLLLALVTAEVGLRVTGALLLGGRPAGRVDPRTGERVFTVLCVGDSWTQGAPYGTYPDYLARRLGARHRDVRFVPVNAGRAGTNSSQGLRNLPAELAAHRPDLLLVLTGNNDHHNLTDSTYWRFEDERLGSLSTLAARLRVSAHSLRVFRLGRTIWQQLRGKATPNEFFEAGGGMRARAGLVAIDIETHRRQLEYNLTRIVELARRERVPVVFQTYFHFHGYRVNEVIRDVASRHGVPLVDHNLLFHTQVPATEREGFRIPDGHPNAAGYALMADHIAGVVDRHALAGQGPAF